MLTEQDQDSRYGHEDLVETYFPDEREMSSFRKGG